jgi:hypothetical protein
MLTTTPPSIVTVVGDPPAIRYCACASAIAEFIAPDKPLSDAARAADDAFKKRGKAVADNIPNITITTTSSINVKPACDLRTFDLFIISSLQNQYGS